MWLFLLQPEVGALSNLGWLSDLFPVIKSPGLLRDPGTALSAVAMSSVWSSLGFTFILVTAGLQGIPAELYEAAAIDGATNSRRFRHITLPMLGPTLLFVLIVLTTRAFQSYGEIDLLTGGGPKPQDSTTTLTYLTYGQNSVIRQRRSPGSDRRVVVRRIARVVAHAVERDRQAGPLWHLTVQPRFPTKQRRRAARDNRRSGVSEGCDWWGATPCCCSCRSWCCSRCTPP